MPKPRTKPLNPREMSLVTRWLVHQDNARAAIEAGYSSKYASQTAWCILNNPHAKAMIDEVRKSVKAEAIHNLEKATEAINKAIEFAYEKGNAMAVVRANEHRDKLYGLVRDKLDVTIETVDIAEALADAERRLQPAIETTYKTIEPISEAEGRRDDPHGIFD